MELPIADCRLPIETIATRRALTIVNRQSSIVNPAAFSIIEILIVVAMLSVIILGLVAMFGLTQRAFRAGMTQTDVLESGRVATDLIGRELEQVTPSYLPTVGRRTNDAPFSQPNFYARLPVYWPLGQPLPGSSFPRTNLLEDLFFLTRRNQEWIGIGYFVRTRDPATGDLIWPLVGEPPPTNGVGTLYRFEANAPALSGRTPAQMFYEFQTAQQANETNVSRILDGVIHFRLRAYNTNGYWIVTDQDVSASGTQTNTDIRVSTIASGEVGQYIFYSNAVPASVELEIGILEDRAWERFKSLPDPASQDRYIINQAGRVHLFRQRIPIRNVDPFAYR